MKCKIKQPNFLPLIIEVNTTFFDSNINGRWWYLYSNVSKTHGCISKPIAQHCVSIHHFLLEVKLDNDIPTNCTWLSVVSVIDVVRGGGTVCTFERKQLRRAEQLKGTAPAAAFLKWRDGSRPTDLLATEWSLVKSTTGKVWNCVEVGDCVTYGPRSKVLVPHCESGTEAFWTLCCHPVSVDCIVFMSSQAFFFA